MTLETSICVRFCVGTLEVAGNESLHGGIPPSQWILVSTFDHGTNGMLVHLSSITLVCSGSLIDPLIVQLVGVH
jgi:hypothetical protein